MNSVMSAPTSTLATKVIKAPPLRDISVDEMMFYGFPHKDLDEEIADWRSDNRQNFLRGFEKIRIALENNIPHFYGRLWAKKIDANNEVTDYGLVSLRVVTTVGVYFIVDAFQNLKELESMKYHGLGVGTGSEAVGDTALGTEITVYNPSSTRATGSTTEGATGNIYRTIGTNVVNGSAAVTEHGLFDQAATGGGVLLDRSVFSAINLSNGDSLQTTYDLTFTAGS